MSLTSQTIKSALWLMARVAGRQLANAVLFFWLAAVLSPAELGIAALSVTLPMFCLPMVIRGIRDAVIQRPNLDDEMLDTAFIVNLGVGTLLACLLAASAPMTASLFKDDRLVSLTLVASLIPFFAASGNLHEALWERHFQHKRITLVYLVSSILASAIAVWVTISGGAIWALVVFNVTAYGLTSCMLWVFSSWFPKGKWSRREALVQIRFASPIIISQTIATGNQRIVEMLIGVMLSPAAVAFFRFGGNFTRLLNQILVTPIIQVLTPAFARSQSTPEANLFRALVLNSAILFPVFMGAASILPEFVIATFGQKWALGGWVGMVLCYSVFASLIGPAAYPLLVVREKGHWTAMLSSSALVVSIVCVLIGARFGTLGAAIGFVLRGVLTIPMVLYVVNRALNISPRRVLASFMPFAILSVGIHLILLFVMSPALASLPVYSAISIELVTGLCLYLLGLRILKRLAPAQHQTLAKTLPRRLRKLI